MEDDSEDPNLPRPYNRGASSPWRQFYCRARKVVNLATDAVRLGTSLTLLIAAATNPMPNEGHGVTELAGLLREIVCYLLTW